jgi:hypothetical protein
MIFYDTETCGLHGMAVLIQWARDDGPINLFNPWKNPIYETLELIETLMREGVVGFNLVFDHFHLCKLYTVFSEYHDHDAYPEDIVNELVALERKARDGVCLKPKTALDLMLHARKGPYQSTMERSDIRVKRVPTAIAFQLAQELEKRVELSNLLFARKKDKHAPRWNVHDLDDKNFKDIVLKFAPSTALKNLAREVLKVNDDDLLLFGDVEVDRRLWPEEFGYAPFAIGPKAWPKVIRHHFNHWEYSTRAREYAERDVIYTRDLYRAFGSPQLGDDDSILACAVAAVRWKGFQIDIEAIKQLRKDRLEASNKAPKAPNQVREYVVPHLSDTEKAVLFQDGKVSTKKVILEAIAKMTLHVKGCDCKACPKHPAAEKAKEVLDARIAQKEIELYDKLLMAGRLHASFKVIGTLSSRMAGADKLNPQGIKREKKVRRCFPLADHKEFELCGGDFESFEVVIADAVFNDPRLREALTTKVHCYECNGTGISKEKECGDCKGTGKTGMKIHALFAESLFPEEDYESVMESKGSSNDMYSKGKSGVFSQLYGGNAKTLKDRLGIGMETAEEASKRWLQRFPGIAKFQSKIERDFCSMIQPGGLGTRVIWREPKEYVESLTGFRRYFTLENQIAKTLFELGETPPEGWKDIKVKVHRRDRDQTALGATRSALFGAAFSIQSSTKRAAANHVIQSTGAVICKRVQRRIWDELQPEGANEWVIQPMNIHDEIMAAVKPEVIDTMTKIVYDTVEGFRSIVPLIAIDWSNNINSWADK